MRFLLTLILCVPCFAGVSVKSGSFTANAGTGSQAVTGVGFQPALVIFRYNNKTADGSAAEAAIGFGACQSSSARFVGMSRASDASANSNTDRILSQARTLSVINSAATVVFDADCTSLDSDGFTINIATADGVQRIINYQAYGGTDITNVKIGSYTASGSSQGVTGVGFQPDMLFLYFANATTGTAAAFTSGFGITTTASSWAFSTSSQDNQASAVAKRYQRSGKSLAVLSSTGVLNTECTTSSFDADGFTEACPTQGSLLINYIAIKGGIWKAGAFNQSASTGAQAITGLGVVPKLLTLASYCSTTQATVQTNNRASIGAGTSSSARYVLWYGDTDAAATMITSQNLDRANIIKCGTEAGASPTFTEGVADLTSLDSVGGFTLNWSAADGTQREILYLALGDTAPSTGFVGRRMAIQ